MKKMILLSGLLITTFAAMSYLARAGSDNFGGSFAGSFLGGTTGSILGSAMTRGSSSSDYDSNRRAIRNLEDAVRRDFQTIERRLDGIIDRLDRLETK